MARRSSDFVIYCEESRPSKKAKLSPYSPRNSLRGSGPLSPIQGVLNNMVNENMHANSAPMFPENAMNLKFLTSDCENGIQREALG